MSDLVERLMDDRDSGLKVDAGGRRYFRQRRVRFQTIEIQILELHDRPLPGYPDRLPFLNWSRDPSYLEVTAFARESSRRYLAFWYRVFDVAVARALGGRDREIYRIPFFVPSTLFDIGIPEQQGYSSVPPLLHRKILAEYRMLKEEPVRYRIYHLSDYLAGLTDDARELLRPYHRLWDLRLERNEALQRIDDILHEMESPLRTAREGETIASRENGLERLLRESMEARILQRFAWISSRGEEKQIRDDGVRNIVYRKKFGDASPLTDTERMLVLRSTAELGLSPALARIERILRFPSLLHSRARSAALYLSQIHRIDLRISRLNWLHRRTGLASSPGPLLDRRKRFEQRLQERLASLQLDRIPEKSRREIREDLTAIHRLSELFAEAPDPEERKAHVDRAIDAWPGSSGAREKGQGHDGESVPAPQDPASLAAEKDLNGAAKYLTLLTEMIQSDADIVHIYRNFESPSKPGPESSSFTTDIAHPPDATDPRYRGLELKLPEGLEPGDPFREGEIVEVVRRVLLKRLRPVRMTASHYSLVPGERHGAMPLNPVMKLWKERPYLSSKESPLLTQLELNSRPSVECLLELAALADPKLKERELSWNRIVMEKRGPEGLAEMKLFLLPGSCYPLREIRREDFPDFRGKVIGETRNPAELGVELSEDAILTGAWYQKSNHALYYTVGGDNGSLLRTIWNSSRFPGPPSFFFALGQFVHDTLPDQLVYYRSGAKTFRECVEEYYREEDRTRKNRGEKFGRKKLDNSRPAIRFMFAVVYARLVMEALTVSSQSHFRHAPTELWMVKNLDIPILSKSDRATFRNIRARARAIIQSYDRLAREEGYPD